MLAHGGGFVLGDINTDDLLCRIVSEHTQSAIVNIEYRLSPEVKAPQHLEDCWKVYKWVSADKPPVLLSHHLANTAYRLTATRHPSAQTTRKSTPSAAVPAAPSLSAWPTKP